MRAQHRSCALVRVYAVDCGGSTGKGGTSADRHRLCVRHGSNICGSISAMNRGLLALICACAAWLAVACDEKDAGTPTPTVFLPVETPVPSAPFTLSLPVDASVALTVENLLGSAYFVLHVDSGLLQVLAPDLSEARIDAQGGGAGVFPNGPMTTRYSYATSTARRISLNSEERSGHRRRSRVPRRRHRLAVACPEMAVGKRRSRPSTVRAW